MRFTDNSESLSTVKKESLSIVSAAEKTSPNMASRPEERDDDLNNIASTLASFKAFHFERNVASTGNSGERTEASANGDIASGDHTVAAAAAAARVSIGNVDGEGQKVKPTKTQVLRKLPLSMKNATIKDNEDSSSIGVKVKLSPPRHQLPLAVSSLKKVKNMQGQKRESNIEGQKRDSKGSVRKVASKKKGSNKLPVSNKKFVKEKSNGDIGLILSKGKVTQTRKKLPLSVGPKRPLDHLNNQINVNKSPNKKARLNMGVGNPFHKVVMHNADTDIKKDAKGAKKKLPSSVADKDGRSNKSKVVSKPKKPKARTVVKSELPGQSLKVGIELEAQKDAIAFTTKLKSVDKHTEKIKKIQEGEKSKSLPKEISTEKHKLTKSIPKAVTASHVGVEVRREGHDTAYIAKNTQNASLADAVEPQFVLEQKRPLKKRVMGAFGATDTTKPVPQKNDFVSKTPPSDQNKTSDHSNFGLVNKTSYSGSGNNQVPNSFEALKLLQEINKYGANQSTQKDANEKTTAYRSSLTVPAKSETMDIDANKWQRLSDMSNSVAEDVASMINHVQGTSSAPSTLVSETNGDKAQQEQLYQQLLLNILQQNSDNSLASSAINTSNASQAFIIDSIMKKNAKGAVTNNGNSNPQLPHQSLLLAQLQASAASNGMTPYNAAAYVAALEKNSPVLAALSASVQEQQQQQAVATQLLLSQILLGGNNDSSMNSNSNGDLHQFTQLQHLLSQTSQQPQSFAKQEDPLLQLSRSDQQSHLWSNQQLQQGISSILQELSNASTTSSNIQSSGGNNADLTTLLACSLLQQQQLYSQSQQYQSPSFPGSQMSVPSTTNLPSLDNLSFASVVAQQQQQQQQQQEIPFHLLAALLQNIGS